MRAFRANPTSRPRSPSALPRPMVSFSNSSSSADARRGRGQAKAPSFLAITCLRLTGRRRRAMASSATRRRFTPKVDQKITLFSEKFLVQPHPSAPAMIHAAEGTRAKVYRLARQKDKKPFALKVFRHAYRDAGLVQGTLRLA